MIIDEDKSMNTDFTANIELVPAATGVDSYTDVQFQGQLAIIHICQKIYPAQVIDIHSVHISDSDRPDTRFKTQQSHTVAWTLIRAEMAAFAGHPVVELLSELGKRCLIFILGNQCDEITNSLAMRTLSQIIEISKLRFPIHLWQSVISDIVRRYIIIYQKSNSATYVDEEAYQALGHGEAAHMELLRRNEYNLSNNLVLADPPSEVIKAATALLDVKICSSVDERQFTSAVLHWHQLLIRVFPTILERGGFIIYEELMKRGLPPDIQAKYGVTNQYALVQKLEQETKNFESLHPLLNKVCSGSESKTSLQTLITDLGFSHFSVPGIGNDCALFSIYHQLTELHKLDVGDISTFASFVREHAGLEVGTMIDLVANGNVVLNAVHQWLELRIPSTSNDGIAIDLWSATRDNGLMQYNNVARIAGTGGVVRVLTLYFNGENHFDSIYGPLSRTIG